MGHRSWSKTSLRCVRERDRVRSLRRIRRTRTVLARIVGHVKLVSALRGPDRALLPSRYQQMRDVAQLVLAQKNVEQVPHRQLVQRLVHVV